MNKWRDEYFYALLREDWEINFNAEFAKNAEEEI